MKLGWANGLRGIAALALLTGAALTRAQAPPDAATGKVVAVRIVKEDGTVLSEARERICFSIRCASRDSPPRPATPRRPRQCSLLWGKLTGKARSLKRWSG